MQLHSLIRVRRGSEYGYGRSLLDEDTCSLVRPVREWTALASVACPAV